MSSPLAVVEGVGCQRCYLYDSHGWQGELLANLGFGLLLISHVMKPPHSGNDPGSLAGRSVGVPTAEGWLGACHPLLAILAVSAVALAVAGVCYPVAGLIDERMGKWITLPPFEFRRWHFVVLGLVVSPIVETFFFQFLIFKGASFVGALRRHPWWVVVLTAVIFGGQHFYSAGSIFISTFVGGVFAGGYLLAGAKRRAFWVVTAAHAIVNLVALVVKW